MYSGEAGTVYSGESGTVYSRELAASAELASTGLNRGDLNIMRRLLRLGRTLWSLLFTHDYILLKNEFANVSDSFRTTLETNSLLHPSLCMYQPPLTSICQIFWP